MESQGNSKGYGGLKDMNFPRGAGTDRVFFPVDLKCDHMNTSCTFPIDSGDQTNTITAPVEISVDSLSHIFCFCSRVSCLLDIK